MHFQDEQILHVFLFLMQNLLDTHLSVAGLKQITKPIDILNKDDFEKELEELGSLRSKADAIASRMTKSISEKRDENPAYYDSFSKRIKDALELYKEKVISEAEYLAKMREIMEDYGWTALRNTSKAATS